MERYDNLFQCFFKWENHFIHHGFWLRQVNRKLCAVCLSLIRRVQKKNRKEFYFFILNDLESLHFSMDEKSYVPTV